MSEVPLYLSNLRDAGIKLTPESGHPPLQGYLAHKKPPPPRTLQ